MSVPFLLRTWRLYGAAFVSLTFWLGCTTAPVACPLTPPSKTDLPTRGISAHQGGMLGCPANTIGAFKRAICRGVHQIELDVRATADGVIVVAHDDQVSGSRETISISEATYNQIKDLDLPSCQGSGDGQHIPTLDQVLAIMPQNIWINMDIKKNDSHVGQLVAEIVAKTHRFDQVIFAARDKAAPAIRLEAKEARQNSLIVNMNRELFRFQYVDATINSCAEFIQLVNVPYVPFVRGKPSHDTMAQLQKAGVRVNYSWLRERDEGDLKIEIQDLFNRGVDFVLVDHVEQGMKAAEILGVPPLVPRWNRASLQTDEPSFHCPATDQ